eukprot:232503-Chlamydomonas_euryale.AAC.3
MASPTRPFDREAFSKGVSHPPPAGTRLPSERVYPSASGGRGRATIAPSIHPVSSCRLRAPASA